MNLVFVAAFAALGVSFPGACPGKDGISYLDEETTSSRRIRLLERFLFVLLFRFQGAFSRGENEFIIKSARRYFGGSEFIIIAALFKRHALARRRRMPLFSS